MQEANSYCRCSDCRFWERASGRSGLCRRHAPSPHQRKDEVVHWSETGGEDGCGEGMRGSGPLVRCVDCLYWSQPGGGLNPQRRRDEPADWWQQAGHCFRYAPHPSPEPGARGFWRVTSGKDGCGDGKTLAQT